MRISSQGQWNDNLLRNVLISHLLYQKPRAWKCRQKGAAKGSVRLIGQYLLQPVWTSVFR